MQTLNVVRCGDLSDDAVMRAYQRKPEHRPRFDNPLLSRRGQLAKSRFDREMQERRFAFPQPSFIDVIGLSTVAGASFGSFTTAKTVLPPGNTVRTLPPNYWEIGTYLEVEVWGGIGTLVTTPGLITFQIMLGSIVVFTTGTMQLNATAHTNLPFHFKALLSVQSVGSGTSAKFMGQSYVIGTMFTVTAAQVDGVNSHTAMMAPKTAAAQGTGFDSTATTVFDFWAGFSISDAANTIKIEQYKAFSWR